MGGVRKRSSGKWSYYFSIGKDADGKYRKHEKGGFSTRKEAEIAMVLAEEEFKKCNQVFVDSNISVDEYITFFLNNYVEINCKYNTKRTYVDLMNNHIKPKLGKYLLKNITPAILQSFLDDLFRSGYSKNTINGIKGLIVNMFKLACHPYGFILHSPAENISIKHYKYRQSKDKKITLDEINEVLNFLQGTEYWIIYYIALWTAMRKGEILALKYSDIDLDNKILYVNHTQVYQGKDNIELGTPKTLSSKREIFISDALVNAIKLHKERQMKIIGESDFICMRDNGKIISKPHIDRCTRKIKENLPHISHLKFHDIRHLTASTLINNGASPVAVKNLLGHSKIQVTIDTYVKVNNKLKNETLELLEKNLL